MNNLLMVVFIIEGVTIVVMLAAFFFLVRSQLRLKRDYQVLNDIVRGNSNDIVSLCSAALAGDGRRIAIDDKINELAAMLTEIKHNEQSDHPYSVDIRKVKNGASVNELMQSSGLSHDEAALLIRLHGAKGQP
jgi:hypothetical protein